MTAAVLYGKEDVKIEKVPIPELERGEVLVKVNVALTCGTDLKVFQRGYHARMIGPGRLGLMLVRVAKLNGCKVIAVVKRDEQVAAAKHFGADDVVQITKVENPVDAVISVTEGRGSDIVIEAVGRPQAWQWAVEMVRRGGVVNFFGGCAAGTKVEIDTNRLHYSELTS